MRGRSAAAARRRLAFGTIASGQNTLAAGGQPVPGYFGTRTRILASVAVAASLGALAGRSFALSPVAVFAVSGIALAGLAAMVGEGTDQLSHRFGPGATGVLQSALGNLPEFFIGVFALRAGLVDVVRSALIGSILANTLLVLGLAFIAGGLRHGAQKFGGGQTRTMSTLLLLAVAAMAIPTIASAASSPGSSPFPPADRTAATRRRSRSSSL